jgi:hypothetical protein
MDWYHKKDTTMLLSEFCGKAGLSQRERKKETYLNVWLGAKHGSQ